MARSNSQERLEREDDPRRDDPDWPVETRRTREIDSDDLRRLAGDDIEPLDLNTARSAVKRTVWHNFDSSAA